MSIAERRAVPLNSRCSRTCVEPACSDRSSREPTGSHSPSVALRTLRSVWVTSRIPPGRMLRRTCAASSSITSDAGSSKVRSEGIDRLFHDPAGTGARGPSPDPRSGPGRGTRRARGPRTGRGRHPGWGCRPRDRARRVAVLSLPGSLRGLLLGGGGLRRLGSLVLVDDGEADLPAGVDLADLHLDLLTDRDDVPDIVHALAVVQLAQLGHVQQRSEEHTSELQSRGHLVCRLLLETKNIPHSREG